MSFHKREPKVIKYRDYKNFDSNKLRSEILRCNFDYTDLRTFKETVFHIFNKYAPVKKSMFVPMKHLLRPKSFTKQS